MAARKKKPAKLEGDLVGITSSLGEDNFQQFADDCIKQYAEKGMLLDVMIWCSIIGYYEAKIEKLESSLSETRALFELKRKP